MRPVIPPNMGGIKHAIGFHTEQAVCGCNCVSGYQSMNKVEFDNAPMGSIRYVMHEGEKKFVISQNNLERLFGLLPEKPDDSFSDEHAWQIEWVRCENVTPIRSELVQFPSAGNPYNQD